MYPMPLWKEIKSNIYILWQWRLLFCLHVWMYFKPNHMNIPCGGYHKKCIKIQILSQALAFGGVWDTGIVPEQPLYIIYSSLFIHFVVSTFFFPEYIIDYT